MMTTEWTPGSILLIGLLALFGFTIIIGLWKLVGTILNLNDRSPYVLVTTGMLGVISLVSIIAYAFVRESDLITVAATSVGALAGSLTMSHQERGRYDE